MVLAGAGAILVGLWWGGALPGPIESALGVSLASERHAAGPPPSAEMAEETLDRVERLRSGGAGERLALGGSELTSVVRYALPGVVPPGIDDPTVTLGGGEVRLSARVAVGAFPRLPQLEEVVGFLPDTVRLELEGGLVPLDRTHLALRVRRVEVGRVPVPKRLIPGVLDGLRRDGGPGLPDDALRVPLPDGLERAYVQRDSLVLVARLEPA